MEIDMTKLNLFGVKSSTLKNLAVAAAVGYVWFGHLSTDGATAASNAQFCLIAAIALFGLHIWTEKSNDAEFHERDSIYRHIDNEADTIARRLSEETDAIHRRIDAMDALIESKSCSRK
jgi:hypothetical protein